MHRNRGIPTTHKGRRFRSRLEARWASFFDRLGWPYEYEPFDLDGWIPDFLLLGTRPVLVEIKPTYVIPTFNIDKLLESGASDEILMLGCTIPIRSVVEGQTGSPFGWLLYPDGPDSWTYTDAFLTDYTKFDSSALHPRPVFGLCGDHGPRVDRLSGFDPTPETWTWADIYSILSVWADAGNKTQWMGAR